MQQETPTQNESTQNPQFTTLNKEAVIASLGEQLIELIKKYIETKFGHDNKGHIFLTVNVGMFLIAIIILSWIGVLRENTIGAIIGSMIGYAFGRFKYDSKKAE